MKHQNSSLFEFASAGEDCLTLGSLDGLRTHIDECIEQRGLAKVRTEECGVCLLLVIARQKSSHFGSDLHRETLQSEQYAQRKRHEQTVNFQTVRLLSIKGIPQQPDTLELLRKTLAKFGGIDEIELSESSGTAMVKFWQQSATQKAINGQPLAIHGSTLTLQQIDLGFFNEEVEGAVNVALCDETVQRLSDWRLLNKHCWGLDRKAKDLANSWIEKKRETELIRDLKGLLSRSGRYDWQVMPFGSRTLGLSLSRDADLDLFAGNESMFYGQVDDSEANVKKAKQVHQIASHLQRSETFEDVRPVARARVPIVIFTHAPTGLKCDLSFINGLSIRNTRFINLMLSLDDRVRPLVLYLKEWISLNGLKSHLSHYAATLLMISYLSQLPQPLLPTLKSLRSSGVPPFTIAGWDVSFKENIAGWRRANAQSVPELLFGFFRHYSEFDYAKYLLYPVEAIPIPREHLLDSDLLPPDIDFHWLRIPLENFSPENSVCVMDPFDLRDNVTKRISPFVFSAMLKLFQMTRELLHKSAPKSVLHSLKQFDAEV